MLFVWNSGSTGFMQVLWNVTDSTSEVYRHGLDYPCTDVLCVSGGTDHTVTTPLWKICEVLQTGWFLRRDVFYCFHMPHSLKRHGSGSYKNISRGGFMKLPVQVAHKLEFLLLSFPLFFVLTLSMYTSQTAMQSCAGWGSVQVQHVLEEAEVDSCYWQLLCKNP